MTISARQMFILSAIFLPLVAIASGSLVMNAYEDEWNHGGKANKKEHPNKKINDSFDPKYTMIIYLDIEGDNADYNGGDRDIIRVRAIRVQFQSNGWNDGVAGNNDWTDNQAKVVSYINQLNAQPPLNPPPLSPPPAQVIEGLDELVFNYPHHVFIYVQNKGIEFDEEHPIWFGKRLLGQHQGVQDNEAKENWSFFGAEVITPVNGLGAPAIAGNYSTKLIYFKNFFYHWKWLTPGYYKIGENQPHWYSLNINARIPVTDMAGGRPASLPIIIDPDTGNNGGGEPTYLTK